MESSPVADRARELLSLFRVGKSYVTILRDPTRLDEVFKLLDTAIDPSSKLATPERIAKILDGVKARPENKGVFERRPLAPKPVDLEELLRYPIGSLGERYATHMISNSLDPNFYTSVEPIDDVHWLSLRLRQSHDLWHVLTNFGVDVAGEIGLQAFTAAIVPAPFPSIIVAGGLLRSIGRGELTLTTEAVADGFNIGRQAKGILGLEFESMWDRPLAEVRRELNIIPVADAQPYSRFGTIN